MHSRAALTLIELVVVLALLVATSSVLVPVFTGTIQNANKVTTTQSLIVVRDTLQEYWRDTKHVELDGILTVATEANRFDIDWLFNNPVTADSTNGFSINTRIGWRGPYIAESTGDLIAAGAPFLIDAWNNEIIVQDVNSSALVRDVRVVSAGPNGSIDIPGGTATAALIASDVGDDIYVALTLH